MKPKKSSQLYRQVSEELNVEQDLVESLVEFYYKDVRGLLHKNEFSWNPNDNYESFLPLDPNQFINDIYEYSLKNQDDPNLYVAKDSGRHFGSAIHYAWKEHFMRRYNDKETN